MIQRMFLTGLAVAVLVGCGSGQSGVQTRLTGQPFFENVSKVATAESPTIDRGQPVEPVALFTGPMPTGVAVSKSGRIFVCIPRWGDAVEHTVVEVVGDKVVPFPDANVTSLDFEHAGSSFVSVQSVFVDDLDRLWVLDTGSINFGPVVPGGAKLVGYDLASNAKVKEYDFPLDVVTKTTYVNDVRFDLRRGDEGTAYLTDSSETGGLIVLDLRTGHSFRRLTDTLPVRPAVNFTPTVENRLLQKGEQPPKLGSDGLAVSADGKTVFFCPLVSEHLYSVPADALADEKVTDAELLPMVTDLGDRGFASDGLVMDSDGTLYLTDYEHNAIQYRTADGHFHVLSSDPRMIWPDSMSISSAATNLGDIIPPNGAKYLYFTANQLNRQPMFRGRDDRKQPYGVYRIRLDLVK